MASTLLLENDLPIFHEGPVLFKDVLVSLAIAWAIRHWPRTRTQHGSTAPATQLDQFVQSTGWISPPMSCRWYRHLPDIVMANGMTRRPTVNTYLCRKVNDTGGVIPALDSTTSQATILALQRNQIQLFTISKSPDGIIFFQRPCLRI
jgi:hypothetical protein